MIISNCMRSLNSFAVSKLVCRQSPSFLAVSANKADCHSIVYPCSCHIYGLLVIVRSRTTHSNRQASRKAMVSTYMNVVELSLGLWHLCFLSPRVSHPNGRNPYRRILLLKQSFENRCASTRLVWERDIRRKASSVWSRRHCTNINQQKREFFAVGVWASQGTRKTSRNQLTKSISIDWQVGGGWSLCDIRLEESYTEDGCFIVIILNIKYKATRSYDCESHERNVKTRFEVPFTDWTNHNVWNRRWWQDHFQLLRQWTVLSLGAPCDSLPVRRETLSYKQLGTETPFRMRVCLWSAFWGNDKDKITRSNTSEGSDVEWRGQ